MSRLFVSDVHLDASAPDATEQFIDFLRTRAAGTEALYILGDLFEVWVGDDDPSTEKGRILTALHELTATGVAGFVIHGNRDFLLGRTFCDRTGFRLLPDPVVMELDGERVLVTHGDALCTGDFAYQELRSTVRTADWQRRFLSLPFEVRDRFASQARAGSKAHNARMAPSIQDVDPDAVTLAYRTARVTRIIHGHTHRPGVHDTVVDDVNVQRIVLGAWYEEGSYLVYENGQYALKTLPRGA